MPRFSANLSFLFGEKPFLERFGACREAGFRFVEYAFPYEFDPGAVKKQLVEHGLIQVLFNLPPGDWAAGDRGLASDPSRIQEFSDGVDKALEYAKVLDVARMNCLSGLRLPNVPIEKQWNTLVNNVRLAAEKLASQGKVLVVEAINTYDMPGFFIHNTKDALKLIEQVGAPNVKFQYDVYHMQKMEGNLVQTIEKNLESIGHIQIADNPGRAQPGTGEINYPYVLNELDRMGYEGCVGCEYVPVPDTETSLSWIGEMGFEL